MISAQVDVPLMVEGRPVGTLAILTFRDHKYQVSDARFLSLLAAIVAPALEAARLGKEVRRHADQQRQSEQLFLAAFEASGIGMALTALDGAVIRANPALCGLLGYGERDLAGMDARGLVATDDLEKVVETL